MVQGQIVVIIDTLHTNCVKEYDHGYVVAGSAATTGAQDKLNWNIHHAQCLH